MYIPIVSGTTTRICLIKIIDVFLYPFLGQIQYQSVIIQQMPIPRLHKIRQNPQRAVAADTDYRLGDENRLASKVRMPVCVSCQTS
jgi:hypothetical protein